MRVVLDTNVLVSAIFAGVATLAFWALGPVLGILALVMIGLAHREGEFLMHRFRGVVERGEAEA